MNSPASRAGLDLSPLERFFDQSVALDAILLLSCLTIFIITAVMV